MPRYIDADAYIENNECCGYLDEMEEDIKIKIGLEIIDKIQAYNDKSSYIYKFIEK